MRPLPPGVGSPIQCDKGSQWLLRDPDPNLTSVSDPIIEPSLSLSPSRISSSQRTVRRGQGSDLARPRLPSSTAAGRLLQGRSESESPSGRVLIADIPNCS